MIHEDRKADPKEIAALQEQVPSELVKDFLGVVIDVVLNPLCHPIGSIYWTIVDSLSVLWRYLCKVDHPQLQNQSGSHRRSQHPNATAGAEGKCKPKASACRPGAFRRGREKFTTRELN